MVSSRDCMLGARRMAQQAKVFATKSNDLSLMPGNQSVAGEGVP